MPGFRPVNRGCRLDYALVSDDSDISAMSGGAKNPRAAFIRSPARSELPVRDLQVSDGLVGKVHETFLAQT